ncbi:unnamed protein product [Tuwongella immobilis]|uniref:Uncharacterized protein n=1 Tax=Tuwongella immobilis TaxID=692036 RepID=A0A6C2YV50_9BACT|nr:unnamed protein product [Tuwongella immobilis]VTS08336.1 unnamed protein product [Tuwongella immobilis]
MIADERQRLLEWGFAADVIERTAQVLTLWGDPPLFGVCSLCGNWCFHPDLPRGKHLRKRLPAELFWRYELVGCRSVAGDLRCLPCDDFEFE